MFTVRTRLETGVRVSTGLTQGQGGRLNCSTLNRAQHLTFLRRETSAVQSKSFDTIALPIVDRWKQQRVLAPWSLRLHSSLLATRQPPESLLRRITLFTTTLTSIQRNSMSWLSLDYGLLDHSFSAYFHHSIRQYQETFGPLALLIYSPTLSNRPEQSAAPLT